MEYKVTFHPRAEQELFELYSYIDENSGPDRAEAFLLDIQNYCLSFSIFPKRGMIRDDIAPGVRVVGYKRVMSIVFKVLFDSVVILGVFYGGRNIALDVPSDSKNHSESDNVTSE